MVDQDGQPALNTVKLSPFISRRLGAPERRRSVS
jgi:hypothetical protein